MVILKHTQGTVHQLHIILLQTICMNKRKYGQRKRYRDEISAVVTLVGMLNRYCGLGHVLRSKVINFPGLFTGIRNTTFLQSRFDLFCYEQFQILDAR